MAKQMTARRNSKGNLTLLVEGVRFGSLYFRKDGSLSGGSFLDDDVRDCFRRLCMNPNNPKNSLSDYLRLARLAWEHVDEELRITAEAEQYAERAWLRHAEYDPEQDGFEQWERSRGKVDMFDEDRLMAAELERQAERAFIAHGYDRLD